MPLSPRRRGAKLLPCLALATVLSCALLPAASAAAQPLDHFRSLVAVFSDRDGSGGPSCGDVLRTSVTVGSSVGTFDLTNLTVRWAVPPNTRLVPGTTTLGFGPESDCTLVSGTSPADTEVVAHCSFLCRTGGDGTGGTCVQVGLDLQARLEILDPNTADRVVLQATAEADQVDPSVSDAIGTQAPDDPSVVAYPPCPPANPPVLAATLADRSAQDHDGDDLVDPGEAVAYTVTIANLGGETADQILFQIPAPSSTQLAVPSLVVPAGAVVLGGDDPGDGAVQVLLPSLAPGATAEIRFGVLVAGSLSTGTVLSAQGTLAADNAAATLTDDPDTSALLDPTLTPIDHDPDLAITVEPIPPAAAPGERILWEILARNLGPATARRARVDLAVPPHTAFDPTASDPRWSCAAPAAGAPCSLELGTMPLLELHRADFTVRVLSPLAAEARETSLLATISDNGVAGPDRDPTNNQAAATATLLGEPALTLTKSGPATARPGDVVAYTLAAGNSGNRDSGGAEILESVPPHTVFAAADSTPGWSCPDGAAPGTTCVLGLGTLAAGGERPATFAVRVAPTLPHGAESTTNTALLRDAAGTPPAEASATTALDAAPALTLAKSGPPSASPGDTVPFTLAYANTGDQDAAGVRLTEAVPAHTRFAATASSPGWSCADGSPPGTACTLTLGALAAGEAGQATFAVVLDAALPAGVESIANAAVLTDGSENPPGGGEVEVPVDAAPDLRLDKAGPSTASPGQTIVFTLAYANAGDQATTATTLHDTVPDHTTFELGASSPGWSCPDGAPAGTACTLDLGPLAAGASSTATFAVRLAATVPPTLTAVRNAALLTGGPEDPPGGDEVDVPVDASATLVLDKRGPATSSPGATIAYTLVHANRGDTTATAATLTDTVPSHTTYSAAASSPGWSCLDGAPAGTSCTLPLGDLPPDAAGSATFAVRVDPAAPAPGEIVNTATLAATGAPPASDTATTALAAGPAEGTLTATLIDTFLEDSDDDGHLGQGDVVGYTAVIENPSPAPVNAARIALTPDPHTHLRAGTVTTTAGTIETGNAAADTTVAVALGDLAAGAEAVVTFEVRLADALPGGLDHIAAQGHVTALDAPPTVTDDPDTAEPLDPTRSPLGDDAGPPTLAEIPTLDVLGLAALALLLAALAARRLNPARSTTR